MAGHRIRLMRRHQSFQKTEYLTAFRSYSGSGVNPNHAKAETASNLVANGRLLYDLFLCAVCALLTKPTEPQVTPIIEISTTLLWRGFYRQADKPTRRETNWAPWTLDS